jgi:hypothetical protein
MRYVTHVTYDEYEETSWMTKERYVAYIILHIITLLEDPTWKFEIYFKYVRFEVFTAVTMKKGAFWDVTPCDSCKNRRFGGT